MQVIEQTMLDLLLRTSKSANSVKSFTGRNYSVNQGSASTSAGRSSSGFRQAPNAASGATGSAGNGASLGGNPIASGAANGGLGGMKLSASANLTGDAGPPSVSKGMSTTDWIIIGGVAIGGFLLIRYLYLESQKEKKMAQEKANSANPKS